MTNTIMDFAVLAVPATCFVAAGCYVGKSASAAVKQASDAAQSNDDPAGDLLNTGVPVSQVFSEAYPVNMDICKL